MLWKSGLDNNKDKGHEKTCLQNVYDKDVDSFMHFRLVVDSNNICREEKSHHVDKRIYSVGCN